MIYLIHYLTRSSSFSKFTGCRDWNEVLKWSFSQAFYKALTTAQKLHCRTSIFGTAPDDCFSLGIWSRYHYNKKHRKFKAMLVWRSSRKMNKNKILLMLHANITLLMAKAFQVFQWTEKMFSILFLFNFIPQLTLNFHLMNLISSKFRQ